MANVQNGTAEEALDALEAAEKAQKEFGATVVAPEDILSLPVSSPSYSLVLYLRSSASLNIFSAIWAIDFPKSVSRNFFPTFSINGIF